MNAFLILLAFLIPFGTKKFLYSFTPVVDEYHAIFIYSTDILLVLFLVSFFFAIRKFHLIPISVKLSALLFWFFAGLSVLLAFYPELALYRFARLTLYILFALAVGVSLSRTRKLFEYICFAIGMSAILQSIIGFFQFLRGESVGLRVLGESVISATTPNVARIMFDGEKYLRALGTMSHANILASFLILGLLSFFYLYIKYSDRNAKHAWIRIYSAVGAFITIFGLAFTFSRSGWIIASLITLFVLAWGFWHKEYRRSIFGLFFVLLVSASLLLSIFSWAIIPRAGFAPGENSVNDRITYNKIGAELVLEHPWGVGVGNQELVGVKEGLYQARGLLDDWRWQPVHNIYILIASEAGIQGILAFLALLGLIFLKYGKNLLRSPEGAIALGVLAVSLLFGLVDHFPWDLPAGQLMMWLAIGLVLGVSRKYTQFETPRRSTDRTQASEV